MPRKASGKGKKTKALSGVVLPAMGEEEELCAGEVVLAKIDLLPLLPGMIVAHSELPPSMIRTRPAKSQHTQEAGDSNETFYPVRFFPKGDYGWASSDRIARLGPSHIAAFIENRISKDTDKRLYAVGKRRVVNAYRMAADPEKWLENLAETKQEDETNGEAKDIGPNPGGRSTGGSDSLDTAKPGRKRIRDESATGDSETVNLEPTRSESLSAVTHSRTEGRPSREADPRRRRIGPRSRTTGFARRAGQRERKQVEGEKAEAEGPGSEEEIEDELASSDATPGLPAHAPDTAPKQDSRGQITTDERASKKIKADNGTYTIATQRLEELQEDPDANQLLKWRCDLEAALFPPKDETPDRLSELATEADNICKSLEWFRGYSKLLGTMKRIALADDERHPRNVENRIRERAAVFTVKWEAVLGGQKIED
ncbi:hypothetical protein C8F01DRAFT_1161789 [Mycena amicta]|nr:hypothetical protein C8F01DRAFT_1161789 [Mycena amicta]